MRLWHLLCLCSLLLQGCARDDVAALEGRLSVFFDIEGRQYFKSKMRCTAAVFVLKTVDPKNSLSVQRTGEDARRAFSMGRLAAVQVDNMSPSDMAEALLLHGNGQLGKQVLAAAAQSGPCLKGTPAEGELRAALTRPGALLAYDSETQGLVVLDHVASRLFYAAGDVW